MWHALQYAPLLWTVIFNTLFRAPVEYFLSGEVGDATFPLRRTDLGRMVGNVLKFLFTLAL